MKVKICGITNIEDAHAAVEAGADALGFIFALSSPRCVRVENARNIVRSLPPFVTPVGVFVDSDRQEILKTIETVGIQAIQFHGNEQPEDLLDYAIQTYKAFRVHDEFDISQIARYSPKAFLLDTFVNSLDGGTGRTFNWDIAVQAKLFGKIILSGGLNTNNIAEAVRTVQPYAIDINSGVESAPGKKDKAKINEVFSILRTMQEFAC